MKYKNKDIIKLVGEALGGTYRPVPSDSAAGLLDEKKYSREVKKLDIKSKQQDIEERKKYTTKIFNLIVGWLIAVSLLLAADLTIKIFRIPGFSDTVMVTLLGTTTVNILGLFVIVAKYLFPRPTI